MARELRTFWATETSYGRAGSVDEARWAAGVVEGMALGIAVVFSGWLAVL